MRLVQLKDQSLDDEGLDSSLRFATFGMTCAEITQRPPFAGATVVEGFRQGRRGKRRWWRIPLNPAFSTTPLRNWGNQRVIPTVGRNLRRCAVRHEAGPAKGPVLGTRGPRFLTPLRYVRNDMCRDYAKASLRGSDGCGRVPPGEKGQETLVDASPLNPAFSTTPLRKLGQPTRHSDRREESKALRCPS